MRIAIDCRKAADFGIGTYIRGLLGGLEALEGEEEYVLFAPSRVRPLLPQSERFRVVENDAPHYSVRELLSLGRAIDATGVDLFHAPHYVVPFTRTRVVTTIHDLIHIHQKLPNPVARIYAHAMIRRAIRKSVRVLTGSEAVRAELIAFDETAQRKVAVAPDGVDASLFHRASAGQERRYFLFVGNDKPHKNIDGAVAAFRLVREEVPAARLVLAGSTPQRFRREHGVTLAGFVTDEELASMYREAIALLLPSYEEGFGLPAVEAMASATPAILGDIPALREVGGDAALFVDPRSPRQIADAMLRVTRDPQLRGSMTEKGEARARKFDWASCARLTVACYRDAVASR